MVKVRERPVRVFETSDGNAPFSRWLRELRDKRATARIDARIGRLKLGMFGDCKGVGQGVQELRIDDGPGYRVYFAVDGDALVILLCGGDKRSQQGDIQRAKRYWQEYQHADQKL